MRKSFLIFILFISTNLFAYNKELALKGGLSYTWAELKTANEEDGLTGMGFNTHVSYQYDNWEFALSSYIYWGDVDGLTYQANGQTIKGDGNFRHVSFGPVLKYHFNQFDIYKDWHIYFGAGPSWSLQTIKIDEPKTNGSFNNNNKLTYESTGGFVMIGVEEKLPYKEMHPVYIEFLYSYKEPRKVSVVDSSDPTETNILSTEEINQDLSGHFFMISMGITVF